MRVWRRGGVKLGESYRTDSIPPPQTAASTRNNPMLILTTYALEPVVIPHNTFVAVFEVTASNMGTNAESGLAAPVATREVTPMAAE